MGGAGNASGGKLGEGDTGICDSIRFFSGLSTGTARSLVTDMGAVKLLHDAADFPGIVVVLDFGAPDLKLCGDFGEPQTVPERHGRAASLVRFVFAGFIQQTRK
jgi:hypothetical protein